MIVSYKIRVIEITGNAKKMQSFIEWQALKTQDGNVVVDNSIPKELSSWTWDPLA